jgi:ATP-dependent RNA helicase DDX55/SPB4
VASLRSNGGHILIGTPGRLDDLLQKCSFLDLRSFEVLVLDEADRLLDMGFKKQVSAALLSATCVCNVPCIVSST